MMRKRRAVLVCDREAKSFDFDDESEQHSIINLSLKQTVKPFPFTFDSLKIDKRKWEEPRQARLFKTLLDLTRSVVYIMVVSILTTLDPNPGFVCW
jgi:hypothetical protein